MNIGILFQRQTKNLQHTQRRGAEHQILVEIDPASTDGEGAKMLSGPEILRQRKAPLAKICFHRRTDDSGQTSDVARRQIIALHETLDITHPAPCGKAHTRRNRHLCIEIQPFLGPPGKKMKVASHCPQEPLCGGKPSRLAFAKDALVDNVDDAVGTIGKLGDPEQRMEITQPTLPFLDIRLDHIAGGAMLLVSTVSLGKLDLDEIGRLETHNLASERGLQLFVERPVAGNEPHLDKAGQDGVVLARSADRILNRSLGMAHLQAEIPQQVKKLFNTGIDSRVMF